MTKVQKKSTSLQMIPAASICALVNEANRCLCADALSVLEPDRQPSQAVGCAGLLSRDLLRGVIFLVAGGKVRILGVVAPVGKNRAESQVLTLIR